MSRPAQLEPSHVRWAALLLVLVQCATLALLVESYRFATTMGALALLARWDRLRIPEERAPHWLWFALLGVILAIKHRVAPESLNEQITFFNTVVAYEVARFLIFLQVVQLYVLRPHGRMPAWFTGVACLSMVFASNVRLNPGTQRTAMALCVCFVGAVAGFAALHRRRAAAQGSRAGRLISAIVLLTVLGGGLATAQVLRKYEGDFERWLAAGAGRNDRRDVSSGFSGRGDLGDIASWKQHATEHVAVRIRSRVAPGYLRGMVFDELRGAIWAETAQVRALEPVSPGRLQMPRPKELLFALSDFDSEARDPETQEFWPDDLNGERLFLPLEASRIATPPARVTLNRNDLTARSGAGGPLPYTAFLEGNRNAVALDPLDRRRFLRVDEFQALDLQPFADEIFAECESTDDKLAAVTHYFHSHFEYALQPQPLHGTDLIVDFLRERRAAHCEYFASAGTLLLRLANVPTRYVTGYVATEWNATGGYWIARRKDAHAWIEAFDEDSGTWKVVECTPPGGVPSHSGSSGWSSWWDARLHQVREWIYRATAGGVRQFLSVVGGLLLTPLGIMGLLLSTAAGVLWKRRRSALARVDLRSNPEYPGLARSLKRADRMARRLGFRRQPAETLSRFAQRLRSNGARARTGPSMLADWYDDYVRIRYGIADANRSAEELAGRLQSLSAAVRRRTVDASPTH